MRYIILILSLITLLQVGCKKPSRYEVSGLVTEFYGAGGVSGAEVEVAYAPIGYGSVSGGYEKVASAICDASGDYALSFNVVSTATFRIRARKDGYLLAEEIVNADTWSTKDQNLQDMVMYKSGMLEFHLINTTKPTAQLLLSFSENSVGCKGCCDYQQGRLYEGLFDTIFNCPVYGNQLIEYKLTRILPGSAIPEDHSVDVDNGTYRIEHHF
ncbi:MAG: carboxypeptidase regulatory-like domain-containing protein [Flavobacteriales bacterium]|nr:carboxypeptidase regulatory-like domain-containing protein [Flavobacteriales bacterium]